MTEEKRGPGRPKKVVEDELPAVKQIVRYISDQGIELNGAEPVWQIDEYLSYYVKAGYTLVRTHYLGKNPEGYGMLYVLTK